ncbi:MAG TPA: GDSL-type esterase/lipase family protein [Armatimonadota bacterium]|nr:GDSL-type esterase/lipase family protein [Armatimonadota bacterium]
MRRTLAALLLLSAAIPAVAQPYTIESFDDLAAIEARKGITAQPAETTYAPADDAAVGAGALTASLAPGGNVTVSINPDLYADNEAWDACNGIRFWLKGDGSDGYGCVAFGPRYPYLYEVWFPLKDASWHQVTYRLDELVSMSAVMPIGTPGMAPPSGMATIVLGTRWRLVWNNEPKPAYSFSIDNVELIADAPPAPPVPAPRPLGEVLRKLKGHEPVRIYCMGDSVTAGTGLADKYHEQYAAVLQGLLRERLGYDGISVQSRAVGGAKLADARAWAVRDFAGEPPDLVTICYGYNDKSAGQPKGFFKYSLSDYIERICRQTGGRAAIVPITTLPGGQWRFVMMDDYAEGVREVCAERGLPCLDLAAQIKPLGRVQWATMLADRAHPKAEGHRWLAERMADWFMEQIGQ